jgi:hypothetical protein
LYVCTCVFLLHQESFDMILVNNPSFYDGDATVVNLGSVSGSVDTKSSPRARRPAGRRHHTQRRILVK